MLQFVILHHLKTSNDDARVCVTVQCVCVCVHVVFMWVCLFMSLCLSRQKFTHSSSLADAFSHTQCCHSSRTHKLFSCVRLCVGVCMCMQETDDNSPSSCGLIFPELKFIQAIFQMSRKAKHAFVFTVI